MSFIDIFWELLYNFNIIKERLEIELKSTGIVREIDALGRIVLPKSIRKNYDLKEKDGIEIFTDGDSIILKKYTPFCIFCESGDDLITYKDRTICKKCAEKIGNAK